MKFLITLMLTVLFICGCTVSPQVQPAQPPAPLVVGSSSYDCKIGSDGHDYAYCEGIFHLPSCRKCMGIQNQRDSLLLFKLDSIMFKYAVGTEAIKVDSKTMYKKQMDSLQELMNGSSK